MEADETLDSKTDRNKYKGNFSRINLRTKAVNKHGMDSTPKQKSRVRSSRGAQSKSPKGIVSTMNSQERRNGRSRKAAQMSPTMSRSPGKRRKSKADLMLEKVKSSIRSSREMDSKDNSKNKYRDKEDGSQGDSSRRVKKMKPLKFTRTLSKRFTARGRSTLEARKQGQSVEKEDAEATDNVAAMNWDL